MAPPSSSSRRLQWSGTDNAAGGELSLPRRRWQSVLQVTRARRKTTEGLFGFRRMMEAEFMGMFLPVFGSMLQRVVSEEVEKAMSRQFSAPAAPPRLLVNRNQHPRYQLMFLNGLKPVYTMTKLESDDGTALKVAIVERLENSRPNIVRYGPLSSSRVEVVVLHGNFNAKNEESWSPEEFKKHIVSGREKSAQLLTGNLALKLNGGEAVLENATFTDNSSFTSTKMFRLGLRLVNSSGERVLEGITKPFRVKERRVEGFEKHYPPMLEDEVWRLKKIGKIGANHQALSDNGIHSVQEFLRAYMKDEQKLIKIFNKMPQSTWKSIIEHAMTCKVGDSLYLYEVQDKDAGLFFDEIYQLVGAKFGDCYKPIDQLNEIEKNLVEALKKGAYQNIDGLQPSYKMVNNYPVLCSFPAQGTSLFSALHPNQQTLNYDMGESSTGVGFGSRPSRETFNTSLGASNVPVDISRFVQGQSSNYMPLRHEQTINRVLPYDSSKGALLPRPRLTQLQIPNSEGTFFGPDASPPAVIPNNILVGQGATLSEESYSGLPVDSLSSTDVIMSLMQSSFQLPRNSDSFSNHSEQQCHGHTTMQLQQFVTGFQPSRTNSFDLNSCDELIQNFISNISKSEGASTPLSPRKWVKIRAALKLASVGRLSRTSRRGPHCNPPRPRLVPII
ncbi:calmodulin-binding protein 60 B-like isoform X2 [Miscanthus floridulus]|uniref:calmodulin-binding protein 60 B-like isoform X2 n=1 Tax=Miscanthus floridulus TaxID=154761 RepID=UPI003459E5EE